MMQSIVTRDVRGEENSRELHTFLRQILPESKQNKRTQEEKSVFLKEHFTGGGMNCIEIGSYM